LPDTTLLHLVDSVAPLYETGVSSRDGLSRAVDFYDAFVPRLWTETIEGHRRDVRDAVLDATATLVEQHGLRSVTMSAIAEKAGIGRATLYRYFPDLESILHAWHERQLAAHLEELTVSRDRARSPVERLEAVLTTYARLSTASRRHRNGELAARLHATEDVARTTGRLHDMVRELIDAGIRAGELRRDVPPAELATYCLHALAAAGDLASEAAVHRLVAVTLAGLQAGP
jgi:AcrR family transcriptional regulator